MNDEVKDPQELPADELKRRLEEQLVSPEQEEPAAESVSIDDLFTDDVLTDALTTDALTTDALTTEDPVTATPVTEVSEQDTVGDISAEQQETQVEGESEDLDPQAPPRHPNLRWYVVHAYSGFEFKAKKSLEEKIRARGMEGLFGEVRVPQETVVELVKGQKKTSTRKYFPGYLLVEMVLNQDTWHLVKETPKISGFVGNATDPAPISEEELRRILEQVEEGAAAPRVRMKFEQGEAVKVVDGPFADFTGTVDEFWPEKGKIRVLISIFGRATPVELDFIQVEKS